MLFLGSIMAVSNNQRMCPSIRFSFIPRNGVIQGAFGKRYHMEKKFMESVSTL